MEQLSALKDKNPIQILKDWLQEAENHPEISQANTMVLSSVSSYGKLRVSSRVVLLKEIQEDQFIFYTNYKSLKGRQLRFRQPCALNFYWPFLKKHIRLEGVTKKIDRSLSLKYWKSRPRESQISQYISQQSEKLENRSVLEKKWQETQKEFYGKEIPCPSHWGGVAFHPNLIEFWIEKPHRLHDRLLFKNKFFFKKKWQSYLLYP
ncbi:MAG: pyridoxamine 5'-phosphate oxidase [Bdellovibrionales bacterium]|nr:pyridoxamine 5'-phosphate oxidase [Bdellovibrionales bacterium]